MPAGAGGRPCTRDVECARIRSVRFVLIGTLAAFAGFLQTPELSGTATVDQPPLLVGRSFPVRDGHATLRLRCASAAPCLGTATLGRGGARYRIAPWQTAR